MISSKGEDADVDAECAISKNSSDDDGGNDFGDELEVSFSPDRPLADKADSNMVDDVVHDDLHNSHLFSSSLRQGSRFLRLTVSMCIPVFPHSRPQPELSANDWRCISLAPKIQSEECVVHALKQELLMRVMEDMPIYLSSPSRINSFWILLH